MKRHLLLVGLIVSLFGCERQTVRMDGYSVHGIDVSHYQKKIDWKTVAAQDVHFVFVKATEGETLQDTLFCQNWLEIKEAGMKRGAYHFFRPGIAPEIQAKNFTACVDMEYGDLAPVLDVEVTDDISPEELRKGMFTWLSMVECSFGIKPIIYSNQKFFNRYLAGYFTDYPIWIARYSSWRKPFLKDNYDWYFWQYGNRGKLDGIIGDVDFNVFKGERYELEKFCLAKQELPAQAATPDALTSNP